jgi:uncharacterized BrkB/YihY/UPF0761 family membrane protein
VGFRWPGSTRMVVFGLWFYLSGAAVLIGAEVNTELLEAAYEKLPVKEVPKRGERYLNHILSTSADRVKLGE